jgi:hypothetical protein
MKFCRIFFCRLVNRSTDKDCGSSETTRTSLAGGRGGEEEGLSVLSQLESEIYIEESRTGAYLNDIVANEEILVLKYTSAKHLNAILTKQTLYAAEGWYTWGDALYVTPVRYPRSTMMYGSVGVAGTFAAKNKVFYNGADQRDYYQQWIRYQALEFNLLTTTVHANRANRELRNRFRSAFKLDCVYFRPDEVCAKYSDPQNDLWLAVTHWNSLGQVSTGDSTAITDLKWVVICCDSFVPKDLGFQAFLHDNLTSAPRAFEVERYVSLESQIRKCYTGNVDKVLIGGF